MMSELNKRAAEYGLAILGSRRRENRYYLATIVGEFRRVSPEATIEVIGEWLDDLEIEAETVKMIMTTRIEQN